MGTDAKKILMDLQYRIDSAPESDPEREKPIPAHTPFKVSKEDYYSNPKLMQDPLLIYCPAKGLAYKLDPEDPWDRRLLDAFGSEKRRQ